MDTVSCALLVLNTSKKILPKPKLSKQSNCLAKYTTGTLILRKDEEGKIKECYVIYHDKAVLIDGAKFIHDDKEASLELIKEKLEELTQK